MKQIFPRNDKVAKFILNQKYRLGVEWFGVNATFLKKLLAPITFKFADVRGFIRFRSDFFVNVIPGG